MTRLTEKLAAALPAGALGAGAAAGGAGAAAGAASAVGKSLAVKGVVGVAVVALGGAGVYGVIRATSGHGTAAPSEQDEGEALPASTLGARPLAPLPATDAARPLPSFALPHSAPTSTASSLAPGGERVVGGGRIRVVAARARARGAPARLGAEGALARGRAQAPLPARRARAGARHDRD